MNTQILVTKPKALNAADKDLLRQAGVVVVESDDPASVRLLGCEPSPMNSTDLFYSAMMAILNGGSQFTQAEFAKQVAAMTKAAHSKKEQRHD